MPIDDPIHHHDAAGLPAARDAARALRAIVERASHGIDLLIWCPRLSPAGGARLIASLAPALARAPSVRSVRLAVPAGSLDAEAKRRFDEASVAVSELAPTAGDGPQRASAIRSGGQIVAIDAGQEWHDATARRLAKRCDLVYAFWAHMDPVPDPGVPLVATVQDTTLIDYPETMEGPWMEEQQRTGAWVGRAAAVVVSSRATRARLADLYGAAGAAAHVVHHAIRPELGVTDAPLPAAARAALPDRYVLWAGNASPHKNLDVVLEAWGRFAQRREWPLVTMGMGTDAVAGFEPGVVVAWRARQLAGIAARAGLRTDTGLIPLGFVPDEWVAPVIARAAALVMPSLNEGGGSFPVEEAMAAGVPVLCADIPVMREHLAQRTATVGWFDPRSVESLLAAVDVLVRDYPARHASARGGVADPRPSWDDVAAGYVRVFEAVLGAR